MELPQLGSSTGWKVSNIWLGHVGSGCSIHRCMRKSGLRAVQARMGSKLGWARLQHPLIPLRGRAGGGTDQVAAPLAHALGGVGSRLSQNLHQLAHMRTRSEYLQGEVFGVLCRWTTVLGPQPQGKTHRHTAWTQSTCCRTRPPSCKWVALMQEWNPYPDEHKI